LGGNLARKQIPDLKAAEMRLCERLLRPFDLLFHQKANPVHNGIDLEVLEPRLALDGDGLTRPQLEQATVIRIDNSLGPNPITFSKSELVGQQTNSFVITQVADGSVVEKWNQATSSWHDVSTPPTTSNPRQLLQLLQNRLIQSGDQLRWKPSSVSSQSQSFFEVIGWDDGSFTPPPNPALLPGAVEDLRVASHADSELTVSWNPPTSGEAPSRYSVTTENGSTTNITITTDTAIDFSNLESGDYTFNVSAINDQGRGPETTATQSLLTFSSYVQAFRNVSLEQGDPTFVRHGAHTEAGAAAIDLYRIAVDVMKDLPNSHPFSWRVQAGIHGTFWTTVLQLKQGMIDKGFMTVEEADEAFASWEVVLNNCNHWVKLWSDAQGTDPSTPTPNFSVVFIAWHRLYIQSFEKVVRQILINEKAKPDSIFATELANANVETWALPYWDYRTPASSALPQGFRDPSHNERPNALYTDIRGADINAGVPLSETRMPDGDLGIVPVPGNNFEEGIDVSAYFNQSVALQQAQTLFTQFNSLAELSPHAVAHDVIGGMSDEALPRISNWIKMVDLARDDNVLNLWNSHTIPSNAGPELTNAITEGNYANVYDFIVDKHQTDPSAITDLIDKSEYLQQFFGVKSSIAPSLIGWVPTAGLDPIFFLHHGYVDKLWTEYNSLPTSAYLQESILDIAGWNFTFWEPDSNGEPALTTYSTWKNADYLAEGEANITSNKVLQACYYPSYVYDSVIPTNVDRVPLPKTSNGALALLENPAFSPKLNVIHPDADTSTPGDQNTITDLAFQVIDLELPLSAGLINELTTPQTDPENIRVAIEMVLNTPMNVSENIGVAVGAKDFLAKNATQIQSYWDSWNKDGGTGNRDGVFDPGEGFSLTNLADVEMDRHHSISTMNNLALARFNPLAMSSNSMPGMVMTTHYSADVSFPTSQQFALDLDIIRQDSQIGIMILSATPMSTASQNTTLSEISSSLHQNITIGDIAGNVDALRYLEDNPAIISNPAALVNIDLWADTHAPNASTYYDRAVDLAFVYLATNPDLALEHVDNPLSALQQYLDTGLSNGRSLDGWLRTAADTYKVGEAFDSDFAKARDYVFGTLDQA